MAPIPLIISANAAEAVNTATKHLKEGQLVAVPTETVYGLAADALNEAAVQNIYRTKGRPSNNPLICHVTGKKMADLYVVLSPMAGKLMDHFWPGPLTLVLPAQSKAGIAPSVQAGLTTLAVRCPASPITGSIIQALNHPIAAPSANPSGEISPTCARDVADAFTGKIPLVIDGGRTEHGIESTIISVLDGKVTLLRPGSITADDIVDVIKAPVFDKESTEISAPGQFASHYAPKASVRLEATKAHMNEVLIGFGEIDGDYNLSPSGDLKEAGHRLFATLRQADTAGKTTIAVAPIPHKGIGIAINDRLKRAAAPRPSKEPSEYD